MCHTPAVRYSHYAAVAVMMGALFKRDAMLLVRQRADRAQLWAMPALYAFLLCFLDAARAVPAALMLVLLFMWPVQILVQRLWMADRRSGVLEQLVLSPTPLVLVTTSRILFMAFGVLLPAMLAAMAVLYIGGRGTFIMRDVVALALAAPACTAVASVVAALTVGVRAQAGLALLLLFPLLLPLLIILAAALTQPDAALAACYLLAAASVVAVPLGAWGTAAALRQQLLT